MMAQALLEAKKAYSKGEVPVGAVLADAQGYILSRAHNQPISLCDPTAHAEILAIRKACSICGNYRLTRCLLVATIEPCIMCMGAAIHSRVSTVIFGAHDVKGGAAGSLYDLSRDYRLNHRMEIVSGVREDECRELMRAFFRARRGKGNKPDNGEVPKWP
ncbi:cytidine and deoxycytidylate deaminase zinc-binding region [delta proteobacterium NaphS2]|nr:cytidine and deoxycytidylate deaminase zinc-binding region [delta proteobacterium NaphS2]